MLDFLEPNGEPELTENFAKINEILFGETGSMQATILEIFDRIETLDNNYDKLEARVAALESK